MPRTEWSIATASAATIEVNILALLCPSLPSPAAPCYAWPRQAMPRVVDRPDFHRGDREKCPCLASPCRAKRGSAPPCRACIYVILLPFRNRKFSEHSAKRAIPAGPPAQFEDVFQLRFLNFFVGFKPQREIQLPWQGQHRSHLTKLLEIGAVRTPNTGTFPFPHLYSLSVTIENILALSCFALRRLATPSFAMLCHTSPLSTLVPLLNDEFTEHASERAKPAGPAARLKDVLDLLFRNFLIRIHRPGEMQLPRQR